MWRVSPRFQQKTANKPRGFLSDSPLPRRGLTWFYKDPPLPPLTDHVVFAPSLTLLRGPFDFVLTLCTVQISPQKLRRPFDPVNDVEYLCYLSKLLSMRV